MQSLELSNHAIIADEESKSEDQMPAPTHDEVDKWRAELEEIEVKIASLSERKALLQQVLETMPAIEKLRGNLPLPQEHDEQDADRAINDALKLVNAIPMVLAKFKRPMTPAEIKFRLKDIGFTKAYGETYFYTAMKRAMEKRTIVKRSDGRYRVAIHADPRPVLE